MPSGGHNSKFGGKPTVSIRLPIEYRQFSESLCHWLTTHDITLKGKQTIQINVIDGRVVRFTVFDE